MHRHAADGPSRREVAAVVHAPSNAASTKTADRICQMAKIPSWQGPRKSSPTRRFCASRREPQGEQ